MKVFEVVIALLMGGAVLAAMARRIGAPYPALVAFAGAALALIPGVPTLVLDPALALALFVFVAPVLADAAFDSSQRDLRANWRAIATAAAHGAPDRRHDRRRRVPACRNGARLGGARLGAGPALG
jgi:monovalent cation/hydrogen antiporter